MASSFQELEDARQQGLGRLRTVADAQANRLEAELRRQRRKLAEEEQAALDAQNDDWAWLKGGLAGLGSGAAAGTTIAPGWGTLIGGLAGFGLGAAGGAFANEVQDPSFIGLVPNLVNAAATGIQGGMQLGNTGSFGTPQRPASGTGNYQNALDATLNEPTKLRFKRDPNAETVQIGGNMRLELEDPFRSRTDEEVSSDESSDVNRYREELDRIRARRGY